jgi:hypothetical protein
MIELKWFPVNWNSTHSMAYSNWVFANNTIVGSINGSYGVYKRDNLLTNVALRAFLWVNNITYDAYGWVGGLPHGPDRAGTGSWDGPPDEVVFDHNVIAHGDRRGGERHRLGTTEFSVFGRTWANAEMMSRATIYKQNTSATPRFMDEDRHDYRLALDDSVACDTGKDLSSLGLPGLERDPYGVRRGANGAWDRGAFEAADPADD